MSKKDVKTKIICDICYEHVTLLYKKHKNKSFYIWVCNKCDEKYPIWKKLKK